jgi:hypothetical protein
MAIARFWLNPFCEDRSKMTCWVSIIGLIFLQGCFWLKPRKVEEMSTNNTIGLKSNSQKSGVAGVQDAKLERGSNP